MNCSTSDRRTHLLATRRPGVPPAFRRAVRSVIFFAIASLSTLLSSCTTDRNIDPTDVLRQQTRLHLRYNHSSGTTYTYRKTTDRRLYGSSSGEAHLLALECRESTRDVENFAVVDSLMYTTNRTSQFPGGQRTVSNFRMTPTGDLPGATNPFAQAAQPLVPLPGLPDEPLVPGRSVTEELPYTSPLSSNARVLTSTRLRTLTPVADGSRILLREQVVQVIQNSYRHRDADRSSVTGETVMRINDTLEITREIEMSGVAGHLISSTETEREVHFIPGSSDAASTGRYAVNESVTRFELVAVNEPRR